MEVDSSNLADEPQRFVREPGSTRHIRRNKKVAGHQGPTTFRSVITLVTATVATGIGAVVGVTATAAISIGAVIGVTVTTATGVGAIVRMTATAATRIGVSVVPTTAALPTRTTTTWVIPAGDDVSVRIDPGCNEVPAVLWIVATSLPVKLLNGRPLE